MSIRLEISSLLGLFLLSAGVSWYTLQTQYERVNTPEVVAQKKVNEAIRRDLCERIERDLNDFKLNPNTFRRVGLRTLEGESRQSLRHLLVAEGIPKDFPIDYRAEESRFAKCQASIEKWLVLPSASDESLAQESQSAGILGKPGETQSQAPGVAPVTRGNRLALVIGNGKYNSRPLRNPENDADDVEAALKELGFEVVSIRNADAVQMRKTFDEYLKKLRTSEVGLVYFSGHGVEYAGRNYLLPVDFQANDEDEIPRQATDLTILVDKVTKAQGKLNIIIVDACRSSFITSSTRMITQGLGKMPPMAGTIVAFSTAPGQVADDGGGRNSPYTKSLLRAMKQPGLKVEDVFKETAKLVEVETAGRQQPWYTSSLTTGYALR